MRDGRDICWCFVIFRIITHYFPIPIASATTVYSSSAFQTEQVVTEGLLLLFYFSPFLVFVSRQ